MIFENKFNKNIVNQQELLDQITDKFTKIQFHPNFILRERLYSGSKHYGEGLQSCHKKFIILGEKITSDSISKLYLSINTERFERITNKLIETLDLFPQVLNSINVKTEIQKFLKITEVELSELEQFIEEGQNFDPSMIKSQAEIDQNKTEELLAKIEDNFSQITSSHNWKSFQAIENNSIEGKEKIDMIKSDLEISFQQSNEVKEIDYLVQLSIIAMKTRSLSADDPTIAIAYLPFYISLAKIFSMESSHVLGEFKNKNVVVEDIKQDVERKINTRQLNWLVKLHKSLLEENTKDILTEFALKLYQLSRDKREEFLWTVIRIAREQSNVSLENLSIAYANLATSLLSIDFDLRERGLNNLANSIQQVEQIKAFDAVTDISEMYETGNVNLDHMIKAIKKQLDDLKEIAYEIIKDDELKTSLKQIIEFTDIDLEITDEFTVEKYIENLGN